MLLVKSCSTLKYTTIRIIIKFIFNLDPYQRDSEEEETHDEVTVIEGEEVKNQAETDGLTVIVPISESEYTITKEVKGHFTFVVS